MKRLVVLFFFISATLSAQYSINGTMSPIENSSWVLLYKIEGTKQLFIKNTQVKKNGNKVTKEYYINDYGNQIKNFAKSVFLRIREIKYNEKNNKQ